MAMVAVGLSSVWFGNVPGNEYTFQHGLHASGSVCRAASHAFTLCKYHARVR